MGWRAALIASIALAVGCAALPSPHSCSSTSDCPEGALCESGICVADRPPAAVIALPSSLVSNIPLLLDGTGSSDPDPGDSVSAWAWTLASVGGNCDPSPLSGSGAKLSVVFPCAGDFNVTLVVKDSIGTASAPATEVLHVAQSTSPPQVTLGSDVTIDHRCTGSPVVCTPWDGVSASVALSSQASGPVGLTFSYSWSVVLPPQPSGQPAPQVSFIPGPNVASPSVLVSTAGTAIAGTYTFTVEATDSRGMVAVGRMRVSVGNRPPVISGGGSLEVPHAFQASTSTFVAAGTTPSLTMVDPDGDPVTSLGFAFTHAGDGGSPFVGQDQGDHATVNVTVPSSDPEWLIGPSVVRRADLTVVDANGATASSGFAVVVTNRAPRLTVAVPTASVNHSYDPVGQRYFALAPLSTWVDDDGDPLSPSVSGDALCPTALVSQGTAWVTCSLAYTGVPAAGALAGAHTLSVSMSEPFAAGPSQATTLTILNRPPQLVASQASVPAACTATANCCATQAGQCTTKDVTFGPGSASLPLVEDEDGDPLALSLSTSGTCLSASAAAQPCASTGCVVALSLCSLASQCLMVFPAGTLSLSASDGLDFVQGSVEVGSVCE